MAGAFESDVDDGDGKGEAPLADVVEEEDDEEGDPKGFVAAASGFADVDPDAPGFLASPGL